MRNTKKKKNTKIIITAKSNTVAANQARNEC